MKRSVICKILMLWMVAVLLTPAAGSRAVTMDWDVAGTALNETHKRWLAYISIFVVPKLINYYGTREQALDSAAVVTWWSLTEGVLRFEQDTHPKNPVSYSNCNGNKSQSATTVCTSGAWQIGIGAIQSPTSVSAANAIIPDLEEILEEGYPNSTVEAVLRMVSRHAGYPGNGSVENAIVESTGRLRAAWLNRVGVVAFVQQYPRILNECWDQCKSWCFKSCGRGSWYETDKWAPNRATANAAIADLREIIDDINVYSKFIDVLPDHPFRNEINWMKTEKITSGCSNGGIFFCPDANVKRDQMASFLAKAAGWTPYWGVDYFSDDDGNVHEGYINRIKQKGVTSGCGGTNYCPNNLVTRGQMATFLCKAKGWGPYWGVDYFSDDDDSVFEGYINRIKQKGITSGCGGDKFCPNNYVPRKHMAAFLYRTFELN